MTEHGGLADVATERNVRKLPTESLFIDSVVALQFRIDVGILLSRNQLGRPKGRKYKSEAQSQSIHVGSEVVE